MKKTVLQQLIDYELELITTNGDTFTAYSILQFIIKKANSLLEQEKQDLIDAKLEGYAEGYQDATNDILSSI